MDYWLKIFILNVAGLSIDPIADLNDLFIVVFPLICIQCCGDESTSSYCLSFHIRSVIISMKGNC